MSHRLLEKSFFWVVFAGSGISLVAAQTNSSVGAQQNYHVSHWTVEDGLPQNRISALAQTPDGYLWIGTWSGLARFDGVRFTVYNEVNTPRMVSQVINALAVDIDGTLWIGTADGLLKYRNRQFTRFTEKEGLPGSMVWRLTASRSGGVWMHTDGKTSHRISVWSDTPSLNAAPLPLPTGEEMRALLENEDGSATVVTSRGMRRVSRRGEI